MPTAVFRFYAELNDFLPPGLRQMAFPHTFQAGATVKDRIEALGPPHPEVELILVGGRPVGFDYQVQHGDRVGVYPPFHRLPLPEGAPMLRPPLSRPVRFVLDTHLGRLAAYLRMLGFDALYSNAWDDATLAHTAATEGRVLLTRDRGLLKRSVVVYGYCLRSLDPTAQLVEVLHRYNLGPEIAPFHRCLSCNGLMEPVAKEAVLEQLEPLTRLYYDEFHRCTQCGQVYWRGSHYTRMERFLEEVLHRLNGPNLAGPRQEHYNP